MPIEIREVVIRAIVSKQQKSSDEAPLLEKDLQRIRREIIDELMDRVETYVRNHRDSR